MTHDLTVLLAKLNQFCLDTLHQATGYCLSCTHYEVGLEHWLLKLLEKDQGDLCLLLEQVSVDRDALRQDLHRALEDYRTGNTSKPAFSPQLVDLLREAWLVSSLVIHSPLIRSGALLLALLERPSVYTVGHWTKRLAKVDRAALVDSFAAFTQIGCETPAVKETAADSKAAPASDNNGQRYLDNYCIDFTLKAEQGDIDPVFGRDQEIRQMMNIMCRRRKNNPILVGEPGVGKTAVVEGLARAIVAKEVPETLSQSRLVGLDMGLLVAGAGVKGEFERRLKGVIADIQASDVPIILFIDEAHTLIGGGGAAGSSDAANLLKPLLARGELLTCAATTWREYKKYFEKDAALARRFQLVKLAEPSVDDTVLILRGMREVYEQDHGIPVHDDALVTAADYSDRYITGRFMPDKAVDLLDTALARVRLSSEMPPGRLQQARGQIQALQQRLRGLERDRAQGLPVDGTVLDQLHNQLNPLQEQTTALETQWRHEQTLVRQLVSLRQQQLNGTEATDSTTATDATTAAAAELADVQQQLQAAQQQEALIEHEVTRDVVAQVVSDWTGIPLGKMAQEQATLILALEDHLAASIKGQTLALKRIASVLQSSTVGITGTKGPRGVFLLTGPSGVGKSATALALAETLFGHENNLITINMSEFQEKHTTSRLIGAPPGYAGYGEGGVLTEAVRRCPYSVVLLDEVEKAHRDVLNLFYQVFDKGVLADGEGITINFKNTIIIMTSNLGAEVLLNADSDSTLVDLEQQVQAIRPTLYNFFHPALLARMTLVPFIPLTETALLAIIQSKLTALQHNLQKNSNVALTFGDDLVQRLAELCRVSESGARNIDAILSTEVLSDLPRQLLTSLVNDNMPTQVQLTVTSEGRIATEFIY